MYFNPKDTTKGAIQREQSKPQEIKNSKKVQANRKQGRGKRTKTETNKTNKMVEVNSSIPKMRVKVV